MNNAAVILPLSVIFDVFCIAVAITLIVKYWNSDRTLVTFSHLLTDAENGDQRVRDRDWFSTARVVAVALWVVFTSLLLSTLILASDANVAVVLFAVIAVVALLPVVLMNGVYGVPSIFSCRGACSSTLHGVAAAIFFVCFPVIFGCLAHQLQETIFYAFAAVMAVVLAGLATCTAIRNTSLKGRNESKVGSLVAALEVAMMGLNASAFLALGIRAYSDLLDENQQDDAKRA